MSYKVLNKNLFIVFHPHPSIFLKGSEMGFEEAISPLWKRGVGGDFHNESFKGR